MAAAASSAAVSSSSLEQDAFPYARPPKGSLDTTTGGPLAALRILGVFFDIFQFGRNYTTNIVHAGDKLWYMQLTPVGHLSKRYSFPLCVFAPQDLTKPGRWGMDGADLIDFEARLEEFRSYLHPNTTVGTWNYYPIPVLVAQCVEEFEPPRHKLTIERDEGRIEVAETWGDWDLCNPTTVLTFAQVTQPPPQSMLRIPEIREVVSIESRRARFIASLLRGHVQVTHGPSPSARRWQWMPFGLFGMTDDEIHQLDDTDRVKWNNAEACRKRLARHLATLPGVLIDMTNDPICPWKGMKFFHGNKYPYLQSQTPDEIKANEGSKKNYNVCQLHWGTYLGADGEEQPATAFTTPYHTKTFAYGHHVYIYKLSVDGKTLRILDLRNDREEGSHGHEEVDPFRHIANLAGLEYGGANRVQKARSLQRLFKDSGVDGAILNSDVEWIWFEPGNVLEWVPPETIGRRMLGDKPLSNLLFNSVGVSRDDLGGIIQTWIDKNIRKVDVAEFLRTSATRDVIAIHQLPVIRWRLDTQSAGYMPQFVVADESRVARIPPLWVIVQHPEETDPHKYAGTQLSVYECDYEAFWRAVCPDLLGVWMADTVSEGGELRHASLPYKRLAEVLREMGVHVVFNLPSGVPQLVPRLANHVFVEGGRMGVPGRNDFRTSFTPYVGQPVPFRHPFKRVATTTTPKRSASSAMAAAAAAVGSAAGGEEPAAKASRTAGKMRRLIM